MSSCIPTVALLNVIFVDINNEFSHKYTCTDILLEATVTGSITMYMYTIQRIQRIQR